MRNAVSVIVTEAVVLINLPKVNRFHLQGLTLDVNQRILEHTASYPAMESLYLLNLLLGNLRNDNGDH